MFAGAELGETSKRVLDDGSVEFVCTAYPAGPADARLRRRRPSI